MKIVTGTHENCGIISGLEKGFESLGQEIKSIVKQRDKYFIDEAYDYDLTKKTLVDKIVDVIPVTGVRERIRALINERKYKSVFNEVSESDLFIYTWDSLLPDFKDIIELKQRGKKVFFLFIGSDVRFAPAFTQQFPEINIPWSQYYLSEDINQKISFIRSIEKYADAIFSVPDQAGLQIRPFFHMHLPLQVDLIPFHYPDSNIPNIIHVPSNRALKGTDLIIKAIDECRQNGLDFNFKIVENQPNAVVKQELSTADIVIDQIYLYGPGMLGIEAMASGNAVATKFLQSYEAFQPPVCYIDHTSVLTSNLKRLIEDREYRRNLAYDGRRFVESNNTPRKIAEKLMAVYEMEINSFDFIPKFFSKAFKLNENQTLSAETKQLNKEIFELYGKSNYDFASLTNRGLI